MGMGIGIGTGMAVSIRNTDRTRVVLKNADGTVAGSFSISKANKAKKKKNLSYNFKEISRMLLLTKTSISAGQVVSKARVNVAMLLRRVKNSQYDEQEVESALVHAKKMERIAKKRMRHLKQEEQAQRQGKCTEEEEWTREQEGEESEAAEEARREQEMSQAELEALMEEYREFVEETMEELEESTELDELYEGVVGAVHRDLDQEDIERLKRKHRAAELRDITEADMKYLKDLFGRLERERQQAASGSGISLELSGTEMPVEVSMDAAQVVEGGSVDVSV